MPRKNYQMKCKVTIEAIKAIDELPNAWTDQDYVNLLELYNYPDGASVPTTELKDFLFLAINDFDPSEAAEILLSYRLSEHLSAGQIQNISHDMLEDKISEEYSDISLHQELFNINELLYKAYNGKFPHIEASTIDLILQFQQKDHPEINAEIIIKAISGGLKEHSLIRRLLEDQLRGKIEFIEAESIVWKYEIRESGKISFITSDYWLNEDDFAESEFQSTIYEFEKDED